MGIVSSVEGKLSADKTNYDLMRATGTVSDAPKSASCRSSPNSKALRAVRMLAGCVDYFSFNTIPGYGYVVQYGDTF